jgi:predicted transcriptional regulator
MAMSKRNVEGRPAVLFLAVTCCVLLIVPASAYVVPYSVMPWSDNAPPVGDAKLPIPVEIWRVPPLTVLLVFTAVLIPFFLMPLEVLTWCSGIVALNFRRIRKKEIFTNDCRTRIYQYIVDNPGSGFAGIMRNLPVNRGTLHYHLGVLCREKLVVAFFAANRTCYFQNGKTFSVPEMEAIARLQNRVNLSICKLLSTLPCTSRNDIAQLLETTGSTVSWHMRRLFRAGLITPAKEGRNVTYQLTPLAARVIAELE